MAEMDLGNWRQRIDEIDLELTKLLNERMSCALQIGQIKKMLGRPIRDAERERALIQKLKDVNHGPMRDETIEEIFRRIISEAVYLEEED
jgi:chorismate mutase